MPNPTGTKNNQFKHINAAIKEIAQSGLKHEVHALGTIIEGKSNKVWKTIRKTFDAALKSGANKELMYLKVYQGSHTINSLQTSGRRVSQKYSTNLNNSQKKPTSRSRSRNKLK